MPSTDHGEQLNDPRLEVEGFIGVHVTRRCGRHFA